jgi:hypothetical protein
MIVAENLGLTRSIEMAENHETISHEKTMTCYIAPQPDPSD